MDPSLDDARAKLGRSRKHLDEHIDEYCALFGLQRIDQNRALPFNDAELVKQHVLDERGSWVVFGQRLPELPDHWGLVLGDAIHNARSALDVLVCQLAILNGKRPERSNGFPIYTQAPKGERQRRRFKDYLKGLKPDHANGVRDLQPFKHPHTRESWCLTTLGVLDNLDKHQLVHPVFSYEDRKPLIEMGVRQRIRLTPMGDFHVEVPDAAREIAGGVLELVRVLTAPGTHVEIQWASSFSVGFGLPEVRLLDLTEIHAYVVGIVESFSPDFA